MKTKLSDILNKMKESFGKLSSKTRKLILVSVVAAVAFSVVAAVILNNKPYESLFNGLIAEEQSEIIGKLQESAIPFRIEGDSIYVPKEQVEKVKAQLVYEGYPKSGFAYDIFKDNISMMTTDFEKESYKLYDLQDRIASLISLFEGVKEAKVTIAPGEDRRYVLDSQNAVNASASVIVIMKDSSSPSEELVAAIQRLVSRSVPQLEFENVSVTDSNGKDLTAGTEQSLTSANKLKLELENEVDTIVGDKIRTILEPIYGPENVIISVRSSIDIDKKIREIINYSAPPNEVDKRGIPSRIGTEQEISKNGEIAGGVVGTDANAEIPTYGTVETDGTENYLRNQNNVDYLVDQVKEQAQRDAGSIEDLTISVTINGTNFGNLSRAEVTDLIAKAAGIAPEAQAQKIALAATPFYEPPVEIPPDDGETEPQAGIPTRWLIIGGIVFGVLLLLLTILLLLAKRRRKKKRMLEQKQGTAVSDILSSDDELGQKKDEFNIDLLSIKNERGLELKEHIRDFVTQNPEVAASLLKTWLKGGEN